MMRGTCAVKKTDERSMRREANRTPEQIKARNIRRERNRKAKKLEEAVQE